MSWNDIEYFRVRAVQERAFADAAEHPNAMAAHAEMAERYDELVLEGKRPTLSVVMSGCTQAAEALSPYRDSDRVERLLSTHSGH